jgi:hypothetical protein
VTQEANTIRYALRPLRKLFGRRRVREFGPAKLKLVREEMIRIGWARRHINQQVGRIKHVFQVGRQQRIDPRCHLPRPPVGGGPAARPQRRAGVGAAEHWRAYLRTDATSERAADARRRAAT